MTTVSTDLHAALTARIDELERIAKDAQANAPGPWGYLMPSLELVDVNLDPVADARSDPAGWHMAMWDPASVLRGLAEDREMLDLARMLRDHARERRSHVDPSGFADDLDEYAAAIEDSLARRHGIEVSHD